MPPHSAPPPLHPHPVGAAAAGCSAAAWRLACWPAWLTAAASPAPAPAPAAHRPAAAGRQRTCRAMNARVSIGRQAWELGKQQPGSPAAPRHRNKQRPPNCGLGPATHGVPPSWRCRIRSSARRCAYRCHLVLCSAVAGRATATVATQRLGRLEVTATSHGQTMRCRPAQLWPLFDSLHLRLTNTSGCTMTSRGARPPAALSRSQFNSWRWAAAPQTHLHRDVWELSHQLCVDVLGLGRPDAAQASHRRLVQLLQPADAQERREGAERLLLSRLWRATI